MASKNMTEDSQLVSTHTHTEWGLMGSSSSRLVVLVSALNKQRESCRRTRYMNVILPLCLCVCVCVFLLGLPPWPNQASHTFTSSLPPSVPISPSHPLSFSHTPSPSPSERGLMGKPDFPFVSLAFSRKRQEKR